ncbi:Molybdate-anion transporter [Hondaea fermentalgiana]|uniref:Molybdate-anion transporter n=1 Tax=Hondaea fermentalgiana TaxID=2315210 RepID=A0A2R5GCZ9_9STRA|nr:Molybdate-anion transporter [Hondaea fermentalgiana]|eukprot:GBG26041.1 Molybdate-anion transporter [Hondaea fermentalgiana]
MTPMQAQAQGHPKFAKGFAIMEEAHAWRWLGGLLVVATAASLRRVQTVNLVSAVSGRSSNRDEVKVDADKDTDAGGPTRGTPRLDALHIEFLVVNGVVRLADWLQGTNMYTLYDSYGLDVSKLFLTGFLTSAVASAFVGGYVDLYGRKRGILMYCALEITIQALEHVPRMDVLLVGRVLGGISTALLFSTFESWVVAEHSARGLPAEALERMFAYNSIINGLSAVLAGVLARAAHGVAGEIGPFQLALALSAVVGVIVAVRWPENYGSAHESAQGQGGSILSAAPAVWMLCLIQACFEGAMYTFVVMWVPSFLHLATAADAARPPTELLFSSLMVALSLGGLVFEMVRETTGLVAIGVALLVFSGLSLLVASAVLERSSKKEEMIVSWFPSAFPGMPHDLLLGAFCVFELCCGAFEPWASTLRARLIDPSAMASVVATMRIPLNLAVWIGVHLSSVYPLWIVFQMLTAVLTLGCFGLLLLGSVLENKPK